MVKEISLCTSSRPGNLLICPKIVDHCLDRSMVSLMVDSTTTMVRSWESRIEGDRGMAEINIDLEFRSLSADIISRACFGSNYTKGKEILSKLRTRQDERNAAKYENDLLQMILEGAKSYGDQESFPSDVSLDRFIVDNSKAIYFAGHETTAITASWCLMLLAANQEWQARARAEVLEICKINLPDADMLRNMKTLTMVIQETMRLYPPVVFVIRRAQHNSKRNEHPNSNPSQHFAMTGLILSLILSEFSFSLSPAYHHSPRFGLVVQPGYGVSLHIRRVS
ncbi:hypothetical protein NC653_032498 [Populus alba x Populus x berolinensis]|uniref:Cytochrome P450 n=1 Tax=Populus alba x Populus x berolinensis TaxID=444605 RepID=A0AAD6PY10_9ROSI|nr:hypothetical protein NC653_032498 [Populus alba x Populus x berolinensis]